MGRAAITAFAANIQAFDFYQCRYRYTKAQAQSLEDALRGKFINAVSHDNRLLVDGDRVLHEGLAPPEKPDFKQAVPVPGQEGAFMVPATIRSDKYLGDGKKEMSYVPQLQAINLRSNDKDYRGLSDDPLGFVGGSRYDGPWFMLANDDRYEYATSGIEEVDGRPVITVRFKDKKILQVKEPLAIAYTYSLDGSRGHLPIRRTSFWNDKPVSQNFVTHVRECSKQRWFPERIVEVALPRKAGMLHSVTEIQVLELDADRRPAASEFTFTIPAGTHVLEAQGDRRDFFILRQDEQISINDLPTLFDMVEKVKKNRLMDTAIESHRPSPWLRWLAAGGGLLFGTAGVIFVWHRRRHRPA